MTAARPVTADLQPDLLVSAADHFGFDCPFPVPAFSEPRDGAPAIDPDYIFDRVTTLAILAGFAFNRRVLVQGMHGTGKSSHIVQVAARLNWPCLRINLDSHISRADLVGRDAIVLVDGQPVTEFHEGFLPWALQRPVALVFDEYDAGRPDVMFVLQRLLEADGALTLLEANRVLVPHAAFRLFATANTLGLGDAAGIYHGTQVLNQGQIDRWSITAALDYLPADAELRILLHKVPDALARDWERAARGMVSLAGLTRAAFRQGDLSTVVTLRTLISWAENLRMFGDLALAFKLSFYNRSEPVERAILAEFFQRCFDLDLDHG